MFLLPATVVDEVAPRRSRRVTACASVTALASALLGLGLLGPDAAHAATTTESLSAATASQPAGTVGTTWGDPTANDLATGGSQTYQAALDPGSLYTIENAIGARAVWWERDSQKRQITGQGVGVALLDTGTADVPGLDGQNKLTYGPDLSIESNSPDLTDQDTNGHGTHIAGIIAAHDPVTLDRKTMAHLSPSVQLGVAPDAELESLKLATTDGSTDVSQVIAAVDWVTQHPTMPDGTPIRVINLAYGTDSVQAYDADPLSAAVENAWKHGIVVVVSGGNEGPQAGRLTDPAMDPYVLAVGASDGKESRDGWAYPSVAAFSSSGTAQRHVDLVAPGRSIASLRAPGSFVDRNFPQGLVAGDAAGRLFRGSGTSQAAAVTSGAVALLLQAYPSLTPDQVKYLLTLTATPVIGGNALTAGAGQLDVAAAMLAAKIMSTPGGSHVFPAGLYTQTWPTSDGHGSIEAARGGYHLVDPQGDVLSGEIDVQGMPWDPTAWWAASSTLTAWNGGMWNGATWTGSGWASTGGWDGSRWDGSRWDGSRWDGSRWDGSRWDGSRWDASRWDGSRWDASRWDGSRWDGTAWSADNWN
jgi:serine protease AprX